MKENNNFKLKSICHCERSEAISQKIATPYGLAMTESGRSMVEMLGVLAVIGVLSVTGVGGYTAAMKRHRANELLNEASKRAVISVAQIAAGRTPSISEFTNPSDHNFELKGPNGTSAWKDTDKQFAITISGVSEAVCQQMKNASGGVIKGFKPDTCADNATVILTFNNDLSAGEDADDNSYAMPASCSTTYAGKCRTVTDSNGRPIGTMIEQYMGHSEAVSACGERGAYSKDDFEYYDSSTSPKHIESDQFYAINAPSGRYWLAEEVPNFTSFDAGYFIYDNVIQESSVYFGPSAGDYLYVLCK